MDEETARNTLTVTEYERWEKLQELYDEAEETREQWADDEDTVADITVRADMDQLGTEVDLYGNDVLVHVDSGNGDLEAHADAVDDILGETDPGDVADLSADDIDAVVGHLLDMLDLVIQRWQGTEWDSLGEDTRADVLHQCRAKWGVDGLLLAWFDIAAAINDDREEKVSAVDSFRQPERRGRR